MATAVAVALWPPVMVYVLTYHPLVLRASVLVFVFAAAVAFRHKPGWGRAMVLGVVLGLAALVRSTFLILPLWVGAWLFLSRRSTKYLSKFAVALILAAAVLSPWVIRNRMVLGAWVPVTTTAGYTALLGNHSGADGTISAAALRRTMDEFPEEFWNRSEPQRDEVFRAKVVSFWRGHPGEAGRLYFKKLLYLWTWRPGVGSLYPSAWTTAYLVTWAIVLPAIIVGWWKSRSDPQAEAPSLFLATWILLSLVYALFAVNMRFRFEAEPLLIPYAMVSAGTVLGMARRRRAASLYGDRETE
jgi:hypothetical protein